MPDYLHLTMQLLDCVCCHARKLLRINLFTKNSDTFYDFFFQENGLRMLQLSQDNLFLPHIPHFIM